ncbi:MAG: 50S ribosomal protein L32 [Chloroflexi bacterium]|nr:50S ribosomal protein L32 [Chloroflexota bacterium]MCH8222313.1 50S ribosomal protein L32 [Chloroflexota bacterium]
MTPLPKKKHSRARRGGRAAHQFISVPGLSVCPHCQSAKLPHRVCEICGTYDGRQITGVETESADAGLEA